MGATDFIASEKISEQVVDFAYVPGF